jgi:hypothetical protein
VRLDRERLDLTGIPDPNNVPLPNN